MHAALHAPQCRCYSPRKFTGSQQTRRAFQEQGGRHLLCQAGMPLIPAACHATTEQVRRLAHDAALQKRVGRVLLADPAAKGYCGGCGRTGQKQWITELADVGEATARRLQLQKWRICFRKPRMSVCSRITDFGRTGVCNCQPRSDKSVVRVHHVHSVQTVCIRGRLNRAKCNGATVAQEPPCRRVGLCTGPRMRAEVCWRARWHPGTVPRPQPCHFEACMPSLRDREPCTALYMFPGHCALVHTCC